MIIVSSQYNTKPVPETRGPGLNNHDPKRAVKFTIFDRVFTQLTLNKGVYASRKEFFNEVMEPCRIAAGMAKNTIEGAYRNLRLQGKIHVLK